jgi:prephenate dehydrogenase
MSDSMQWVAQRLSADRATNSRRIAVSTSVIVGGSNGIGRRLAQRHADRGHSVFITSRHAARAEEAAAHIGGNTIGLAMDLAEPETIAGALQVGNSPKWLHARDTHPHVQRTSIGTLVTMDEVVDAVDFLLSNGGMDGSNLHVDGGLLTS